MKKFKLGDIVAVKRKFVVAELYGDIHNNQIMCKALNYRGKDNEFFFEPDDLILIKRKKS